MYVAEEWAKRFRDETRAAHQARDTAEDHLNVLRTQQKQLAEQVKKANQDKASAEAGMKNMEKQAETIRGELHLCQINMETEKQMVLSLREELRQAKEAAQLQKEAAEAEKQASYALGVEETQSRLTEEFAAVAREYCDVTWGKALDVAGVPGDSSLRRPESVYYDPEIQPLSDSDPPPPEQPASTPEAPVATLDLPASVEGPTVSHQDAGQGEKAEASQGDAPGVAPPQSAPVADHQDPKSKA